MYLFSLIYIEIYASYIFAVIIGLQCLIELWQHLQISIHF